MSAIVCATCNECGSNSLLIDEDIQDPEIQERQMGNERFYWASCYGECEECDNDMTAEVAFSVYASEWVVSEIDCTNCKVLELNGFELLIEEGKRIKEVSEDTDIEETQNWAERPTGCVVFVEGKDDQFVISEFLGRALKTDLYSMGVVVLTGMAGGKEDVVKSANFVANVAKRTRKKINFIVVLDGDASTWAKTAQGSVKGKLFVLSKKEIESYLLDSHAIARALASSEEDVRNLLKRSRGQGKESLDFVLRSLRVRPSKETKQIIARHLERVPDDFLKLAKIVQELK